MNVPNLLSCFRILLIPLFIILFFALPQEQYYWLAVVLAVSGLTDVLDGYIARKYNQITSLGKVLDPVADKLTVAAVLFCLAFLYHQTTVALVVYVAKECLMGLGGVVLFRRGTRPVAARWFGKLATLVTYTVMFLLIIIPQILDIWLVVCNVLVIAVTLFALVMYANEFIRQYKKAGNV